MTTLRKQAALIHRIINGGVENTDNQYDDNYTAELFRSGMNEVLKMAPLAKRQMNDDRSQETMYVATYPKIEVLFDKDTERSYAELPSFFVSQAYNRGIHMVSAMDKPLEPMIQFLFPAVYTNLPAGKLQGRKGYYNEGLRIYWDMKVSELAVKKVLIKLIVAAPDSIGLNDILPITPEQAAAIRDRVIAWYKGQGLQDKIADTNPDRGVRLDTDQRSNAGARRRR